MTTTIMTVRGPIDASQVLPGGILACQRVLQKLPAHDADVAIAPEDLMRLREHPLESQNACLVSEDKAFRELEALRSVGCNTIVDLQPKALRDPRRLQSLAQRLDMHVLASTSIDATQDASVDAAAKALTLELQFGMDDTSIQASVIYHVVDIRNVHSGHWAAVAQAQLATSAPVYLELNPFPTCGYEADVLALLISFTGRRDKLVLCHCDLLPLSMLTQFAALQIVLSFDLSGLEAVTEVLPFATLPPAAYVPRDREIAATLHVLLAAVPTAKVLINSTVHFKTQYTRYGGGGYTHIFASFAARALTTADVRARVLLHEPLALLAGYVPPPSAEIPKNYIDCSICKTAFEPIVGEYFTKFAFVYCSTKCLRKHRIANFAPLEEPSR
ncbi:hypothetical protein SPRG_19217 [Saprolegnia parasitica CBS 223.65]|uniref:Vms1-associating treble clef domain-containing protein n=1 Tax=Saprolegnia parasitica (strain CBS 223.65) TaxID=695850 RepID=A0A067D4D8_SAPPC|nr:hypothetical protein SPRG_19217 [Saprolegnia parasitica CBS 223.65]KDO33586.1 hypothetical protein SPRG_19217 [Saprolegnia parasitica CBS 223.65]|eukprot:XP_012195638.1 hypothetical protein SPRG_19217 [Saprolegnia parasitica CBS 223.65]